MTMCINNCRYGGCAGCFHTEDTSAWHRESRWGFGLAFLCRITQLLLQQGATRPQHKIPIYQHLQQDRWTGWPWHVLRGSALKEYDESMLSRWALILLVYVLQILQLFRCHSASIETLFYSHCVAAFCSTFCSRIECWQLTAQILTW